MIDKYQNLNIIRDTYLPEQCAVCFIDNNNCDKKCYGINDNNNNNNGDAYGIVIHAIVNHNMQKQ